jgi:hypothetical protein
MTYRMASDDDENKLAAVPNRAIQGLSNDLMGESRGGFKGRNRGGTKTTQNLLKKSPPKAEASTHPDHQTELARAKDKYDELLEAYEQQALTISQLQSTRIRAGPKFGTPTDTEIMDDFTRLKGAILQLVRNHVSKYKTDVVEPIDQLWVQSQVASGLHRNYFAKTIRPFGFRSDEINDTLQGLELIAEDLDYNGRMLVTPRPSSFGQLTVLQKMTYEIGALPLFK